MVGPGASFFGDEERNELLDVMESGNLFRYGNKENRKFKHKVFTFEKLFSEYIGMKNCVAVCNGTAALMCCLAALGIGPGDEVIVPGYTFIASISSIIYSKAIPVLCEIDESLTIDPYDIEKKITKKTKAIMPVHMLGNPCDMDKIMKIAKKYNLFVIEDACQALGASYKGKKLGSIGNMGAFSLNCFKTISTGDGGIVVSDDDFLFERAFGFHDQGHKPSRMGVEVGSRSLIGLNFRMNELTGAVAVAQIRKVKDILSILREKKNRLKNGISKSRSIDFRRINDENECATLLTMIFKNQKIAQKFCNEIGTKTLINSGWHVYDNMENILGKKMPTKIQCPFVCPYYNEETNYYNNMLPKTDNILSRAVNISVGVVDEGIGAGFGINISSSNVEIDNCAEKINRAIANVDKI